MINCSSATSVASCFQQINKFTPINQFDLSRNAFLKNLSFRPQTAVKLATFPAKLKAQCGARWIAPRDEWFAALNGAIFRWTFFLLRHRLIYDSRFRENMIVKCPKTPINQAQLFGEEKTLQIKSKLQSLTFIYGAYSSHDLDDFAIIHQIKRRADNYLVSIFFHKIAPWLWLRFTFLRPRIMNVSISFDMIQFLSFNP